MKTTQTLERLSLIIACVLCVDLAPTLARAASFRGRHELLLSGEDWTIASFPPGEGIQQRAFAEGYPAARALAAVVPGDVHWDLERAGKIPPIYYGMNSREIGWVAGHEWWYQKSFTVPAGAQGRRFWLRFDAADYLAEVWLNGHFLGRHEGQFTPFEFEVAKTLRPSATNVLTVLIHPAPASVRAAIARGAGEWPVMQAIRKAYPCWKSQTNAGWDWGAKIITMGLWQDVRLIVTDGARLANLTVQPRLSAPFDRAKLLIQMQVDSPQHPRLEFTCQVRCLTAPDPPTRMTQIVDLASSGPRVALQMTVPKPRLWWPNGYGPQHLYALTVIARPASGGKELDRTTTTFGIRDLQMLPNPEAPDNFVYLDYTTDQAVSHKLPQPPPERQYLIQINGRRIFARGGNWLPCDLLYGRPRQPFYEHLIRLAAQANFNLFRVWGGGVIDKPVFFDLCDRYGIMLFQEFPNAGARLPETDEALALAAQETRGVLPLLINHPCIVRYGGGNEWYRNAQNSRQMAQLRRLCNELDPTRPFHDPDPECIAQRHGPYAYDWATHYATYNTGYPLTVGPDNPLEWTEYGASGAASVDTLQHIMPAEHLWPIHSSDRYWIWHKAFAAFGADNWLAPAQYLHLFGELPDLAATVRCSQFVQAEGLRYADQSMRRHEWHRSACTFWTYNEPWPNAAHGCVVEYFGQPKMAYYYTRNSYAPVDVSAEYSSLVCHPDTRFPLKLYVTSDRTGPLMACRLSATVVDIRGREYDHADWRLEVGPEATTTAGTFEFKAPKESAGSVVLVQLQLRDSEGKELSTQTYTFGVVSENPAEASAALQVPAVSPDGRRNLALLAGTKAAASSVIPGYAIHQVAHLNDGWYGNEASWIEGERPSWAQIDLAAAYSISRVCVGNDHTRRFTDRGATEFRVLAALDYAEDSRSPTWQTVATFKGEPLQGTKTFDFEPVRARWIRIDITQGAGTRMDEIEVYEALPLPTNQVAAAQAAAVRGPMPVTPEQAVPRGCLRPLLTAPAAELELSVSPGTEPDRSGSFARTCRATVRNRGKVPALFVKLDTDSADTMRCHVADSFFTLLAGGTREVDVSLFHQRQPEDRAHPVRLRARAWNSAEVSVPLE